MFERWPQLRSVLKRCDIDRAVGYSLLSRGWAACAGIFNVFFVTRFLRLDEQGFFYTFGSIIALNFLIELGLSNVLLQCCSHEMANLSWSQMATLQGDARAKSRIAQFLKIALKWYGAASFTVLIAVTPAGLWFFSKHGTSQVQWVLPWILLSSCSALSLLILPFVAVLEGCGRVADVATMRLGQNVTASLLCWLALAMHWSLLAYPLFAAASLGWQVVWLSARARYFFLDILRVRWSHSIVSWRREVWPFQWRIALTWLSSYFVSQLFNPVLFAFHGPAVAGQMGMSLGVANALLATGVTWMNTKCAPMGTLVARTDFPALDRMFFATMRNSFLLLLTGAAVVFTAVLFVNSRHMPIATRLLPPLPMLLLLATTLANHVVQCEAMYLRAHKREPLLPLALLTGATTGLLTYCVGRWYGATGVTVAYFATTVFLSVTGSTLIFRRKQKAWHAPSLVQPLTTVMLHAPADY